MITDNNSVIRKATNTVICASQNPGIPNIPIGVLTYLKGPITNSYSWSILSQPTGSTAALNGATTRTPSLRPVVEGNYVIREAVSGTNLTVTAAKFIGVGVCAYCHGSGAVITGFGLDDMVTPWSHTGHATMAQRGIDGQLGSFYRESCLQCHTVGYNKTPSASNGGFDDVQAAVGWNFPSVRQPGTYTNGVPDALKAVSNIQCENCHGPGSYHPGSNSGNVSLDYRVCATCHQDGSHHVFPEQWEISAHAMADQIPSFAAGCGINCHVPNGFVQNSKGIKPTPGQTGKISCQVCHDPHNVKGFPGGADGAHQVRIYDTVTLGDITKTNGTITPSGSLVGTISTVTLSNKGTAATCMACHNARALPYQNVGSIASPTNSYMVNLPHESTAAEVLNGLGGVDNGQSIPNSFHKLGGVVCTDCHMHQLAAGETIKVGDQAELLITNVTPAETHIGTYQNLLGNHTFSMAYVTDQQVEIQDIAACNKCHPAGDPVSDFDHEGVTIDDFDGTNGVQGVQSEVAGLLSILSNKFDRVGVTVFDAFPFVDTNTYKAVTNQFPFAAAPIRRALWNRVLILRDLSYGVHNTRYTVGLLQSSYTDLSTNCIDRITITKGNPFFVDYPAAVGP
jgi:hypothetical protein